MKPSIPRNIDPDLLMSWGGIFEKEKKVMSTFTEEKIKYILEHPSEKTNEYENRYLIYRMLQALYSRQTEDEKRIHGAKVTNKIGFNKYDAQFLTSVAKSSLAYKNLSWRQAFAVGKALVKYRKQLLEIASSYQLKKVELATTRVPAAQEEILQTESAYASYAKGWIGTSKESQFGEGDDAILDI